MAFPAHAIRLMAMQYRPNPPSRTSMRGATSDNEARIVRDERESFDDDAALERRVTQRITLKAKGREHEVARRRLRDLKMEAEEAERAIAKEGHRKGKHEGEGKEKHHTLTTPRRNSSSSSPKASEAKSQTSGARRTNKKSDDMTCRMYRHPEDDATMMTNNVLVQQGATVRRHRLASKEKNDPTP